MTPGRRARCRGDDALADLAERWALVRQLALHRRHRHRLDAARDDEVEVAKIGRHVEREAVPGDPVARVHADRRDLAAARPDAGEAGVPLAGNAEVAERVDQRLLDLPQIPVQILLVALEVDDRIADELARARER